jgi:hypothetical protein
MTRIVLWVLLATISFAPGQLLAQGAPAGFDHFTTGFDLDGAHLTLECETCHVGGVFQGTPTECGSCHVAGGRIRAEAKPADHVLSTEFCEDCHRTTAWFPLATMNHDAIFGSCTTCHNNVQSVGKPPLHPPTRQECDSCHRTTGWFPVFFDHADVTQSCIACHDGVGATGKPPSHFGTLLECDTCHSRNAWTPLTFTHSSANYPGDHAVSLTCADCHTANAQAVPWPFPVYAPDCAACHASDYRPGPHRNATVSALRDCAGACHKQTPEHSVRKREW